MSIKKCSMCNAEYDDEINSVCPVCGAAEGEAAEKPEEAIDAPQEALEAESTAEACSEECGKNEGKACCCKKNPLAIAAIVLAVLVAVAAAWLVYAKVSLSSYIPDVIDVKDFSIEDVEGTYLDSSLGVQYTFSKEAVEVDVVPESEIEQSESDPAGDSAADSAAEPVETVTESFDGTFLCSYNKDKIPEIIARDFISFSQNTDDYEAYKAENKIKGEDYVGYVKSKGLTEDMDKFDADNNITVSLEAYSENGYWRYADGAIGIYDGTGYHQMDLIVTQNGLIQSETLFAGKIERREAFNAEFTMEQISAGTSVNIRLYKDGYFMFENVSPEGVPSIMAGTYRISDGRIYLNLEGNESAFYLTDSGLTPYLFVK